MTEAESEWVLTQIMFRLRDLGTEFSAGDVYEQAQEALVLPSYW